MSVHRDLQTAADFVCFDRLELISTESGVLRCSNGADVEVSAWDEGIFRLRIAHTDAPDYGILAATRPVDAPANDHEGIADANGRLSIHAGKARLVIERSPMRIELWRGDRCVLQSITDEHFRGWSRLPAFGQDGKRYTAAFALASGEAVYGLGEKFGKLDKRGQLIHSYVADALGVNTDLAYKNTPFAWSPYGWGVFVHSPATVTHGVGHAQWSHRSYALVLDEPRLDLFLIAADSPADILDAYTRVTGKAAQVPLWSFGVWVSRAYYRTADEILDAAKTLRDKEFPADVITFDGRAWQDTPTRFEFKFDPSRYSDPAAVIATLKDTYGFKVCAWEYPLISVANAHFEELAAKGYFLKTRDGDVYRYNWDIDEKTSPFGKVLTPLPVSGIIDFTNPEAYAYWRDQHRKLFELGVDVMKVDFGEQVPADAVAYNGDDGNRLHSVYPLLYNRCVYEASAAYYGDQTCVWSRASWAGSQRYPLQWGGDPQSDWEGMAGSVRGGLCWGLSGAPYHATDVGGFYGKEQPSAALYLRWVQWSVFSSHFRMHGIGPREPWCFGPEAERIARQWFKLRYRLIPYLAGVAANAVRTGLPVMRAMVLAFPNDPVAATFEEQFMCGEALLIAPVLSPDNHVTMWLPEGDWYDVWTGEHYRGGRILRIQDIALDRIPVFLRAGHALPLGRVVRTTAEIDIAAPIEHVLACGHIEVAPTCVGDALLLEGGTVVARGGGVMPTVARLTLA